MSYKDDTIEKFVFIEKYYKQNYGVRRTAKLMNLSKDTISRYFKLLEEGLNAHELYLRYKANKKKCGRKRIPLTKKQLTYIETKLRVGWGLDVIAGYAKRKRIKMPSTATLYRNVDRDVIDKNLLLRKGKIKYKQRSKMVDKIVDGNTIAVRNEMHPEIAENKKFGHFEGDTIVGRNHKSQVITLAERKTKSSIILTTTGKADNVADRIIEWNKYINLKNPITITFDCGNEFAGWKDIEARTEGKIKVFFADAGKPSQRGLNEGNNAIIRRDLKKKTDLNQSQEELNTIADKINSIPRKILGYLSPNELLKKTIRRDNILLVS